MKKYLINTFTLLTIMISGCAVPAYNHVNEVIEISEPDIGELAIAYIGDPMVKQGKYSEQDAIYVNEDTKISIHYNVRKGYYTKQGEDKKWEYFYPSPVQEGGRIDKGFLSDPPKALARRIGSRNLSVVTVFNVRVGGKLVNFQEKKLPVESEDSFQQTLIYNGKIGNKINIGYREFLNTFARPTFSNEAEYDLSESSTIGYKGALVEVVEATNQLIKYKLVRNFNSVKGSSVEGPTPMGTSAVKQVFESSGTGFAITDNGHIVTNFHVIEGAEEILIKIRDQGAFPAILLRSDKANDIAVLKIESKTAPLLINRDRVPRKGEEVLALGYPRIDTQGNELKATTGRINSLSGIDNDHRFFQIDAPVQPGNSGGPLLTLSGEVVGVVTGTLSPLLQLVQDGSIPQNVNYSMKSDYLIPMIKDLPITYSSADQTERELVELIAECEDSVVVVLTKSFR